MNNLTSNPNQNGKTLNLKGDDLLNIEGVVQNEVNKVEKATIK